MAHWDDKAAHGAQQTQAKTSSVLNDLFTKGGYMQIEKQAEKSDQKLRRMLSKSKDGVIAISPDGASEMLAELNFPGQRGIDSRRVFGHLHAIIHGDWVESYPIHFAALPDGRIWLVDGQHRMKAISQSQSAVKVAVRIVDVESEQEARSFYAGFDGKGAVRTNAQILDAVQLAKTMGLSNRMTRAVYEAAPLLLNGLEPPHGNVKNQANKDVHLQSAKLAAATNWAKEAAAYESAIKGAGPGFYEKLRKTGPVSVGLYTFRYQPKKACEFWQGVADNDGLRKGDPRHTLVQDLFVRNLATGSVRQRIQQSALAWNAFYEGRDLKIIKCVVGSVITLSGTPLNGKGTK